MHHERSEVFFQADPFLEFVLLTGQFHRFSHREFLVKFDPIDLFDLFSLYFHTMLFFENFFSKDPVQYLHAVLSETCPFLRAQQPDDKFHLLKLTQHQLSLHDMLQVHCESLPFPKNVPYDVLRRMQVSNFQSFALPDQTAITHT